MGKILLKYEFTLQKQKEYWSLMKAIGNYCGQDIEQFLDNLKMNTQSQIESEEMNRITEESVDFKVEEGFEPSH